jgi:hypothetical protein
VLAAGWSGTPAPDDAEYLAQLFASVSPAIPAFEYRDAKGDVRWASPMPAPDTTEIRGQGQDIAASLAASADMTGTNGQRGSSPPAAPAMTVRLPVETATGRGEARLGDVIARLSLAALMPVDASVRLPNGARLQWVDRATGQALLPPFAPDSLLGRDRFTTTDVDWIAVHRSLADPEVDLILAAPLEAYVQPFEGVARTGVITLAAVALLALMLSGFLTTRLTVSPPRSTA